MPAAKYSTSQAKSYILFSQFREWTYQAIHRKKNVRSQSIHSTRCIHKDMNKSQTWERSAHLVKNISVTNQYLEHIRESHDPSLQLKTIEDELKGTIGKALGKAGEKVTRAIRSMEEQKFLYDKWVQTHLQDHTNRHTDTLGNERHEEIELIVTRYNEFRKQAIQARWELTVHRQAIGFTVNNQKTVADIFRIDDPLLCPLLSRVEQKGSL